MELFDFVETDLGDKMKGKALIFLLISIAITCLSIWLIFMLIQSNNENIKLSSRIGDMITQDQELQISLQETKDDNDNLMKIAFPRMFDNINELKEWLSYQKFYLQSSDDLLTYQRYVDSEYTITLNHYTKDSNLLFNLAKHDGYWMSVIPINFDLDRKKIFVLSGQLMILRGISAVDEVFVPIASDQKGFLFCMTILKDGTFVLIDPISMDLSSSVSLKDFKMDSYQELLKR